MNHRATVRTRSGRSRRGLPGLALLVPGLLAAALLGACQTSQPRTQPVQPPQYASLPPITLSVARVEVVDRYRPTGAFPNVEHTLPQTPSDVIRLWADQRLRPVGGSGVLRLYIDDASISVEELARTPGIAGVLVNEQAQRYIARYDVDLQLDDPFRFGGSGGSTGGSAEGRITVPENISPVGRQAELIRLERQTMDVLDQRLELEILRSLSPIVVR